jgi:GNAT superfamily N-acetyltransferase
VRRGIYSDHILWLVIEDDEAGGPTSRIVASGAAILDFGDYNDQVAEIGRLVVDPRVSGKGLGRQLLAALVDASDDRVEFAFGEARTTHIKTQRIFDRVGLQPLGFLPMAYPIEWRESWILSGQLFNTGRSLRRAGSAQIIPSVEPIARLSLKNLGLEESITVLPDARPYPIDHELTIEPLSGSSLIRLMKIEHGRVLDPEVFGGLHLDQGISHLKSRKAAYLVASHQGEMLGAVGYVPDSASRSVRIVELIAGDGYVKGCLLRRAVEDAEGLHEAEVIDCDVSASSPRIQRTLYDLGFLPAAYVPGMVFHHTARWDVVRMIKLNVGWDLGPMELTESGQAMFDVVAPAFAERCNQRARKQPARAAEIFHCLSPIEMEYLQGACTEVNAASGEIVSLDGFSIILQGSFEAGEQIFSAGRSLGASHLLGRAGVTALRAVQDSCLLHLSLRAFDALCDAHPRLGITLFRCLANLDGTD